MSAIPSKQLGKNGPFVPVMGFGAMSLSTGTLESDEARFKVLDRAYELGQTFWDSADIYAYSEDLLGKWFKSRGNRHNIFLATKFGLVTEASGISYRSDPEYVRQSCERSLTRLGIPTIDLYYCHRLDSKTPIEHTIKVMAELKAEGKIKYLGLSEVSSASLRRAYAVHPITAVQVEYSPFAIDIEHPDNGLLQTCRELGVAVVAYSPLGRGFATGAYRSPDDFAEDDYRRYFPRFYPENFANNLKLADALKEIADKKNVTPGQVTLAWLISNDTFPIPGTKRIKYLEENIGALEVQLTQEEAEAIRKAVDEAEVHGDRYPQSMVDALFADSPLPSS